MKVDVSEYRGVWVFAEVDEGRLARVSIELLGKGRELADKLDVNLAACLLGESVKDLAKELIYYGADRVILMESPMLKEYCAERYSDVLSQQVTEEKPEILIVGATPLGRDLTPRVAARLGTGCTADCTGLDIDEESRLFVSTRPAFGGNVMATIVCPEHRPQMSTVRPGTMTFPQRDETRKGEIEEIQVKFSQEEPEVSIVESKKADSIGLNIEEADRIVAIGSGVGDERTFEMINELAKLLEAEVGGSRMVVEAGWLPHDQQIGQTGKTVRPSLYLACGISGAVQHTAGMSGSKVIVAINRDSGAEIFKFADYGIVADISDVLPAIIAELKGGKEED
jgi:electron transfer flavoprotein alpha subunit